MFMGLIFILDGFFDGCMILPCESFFETIIWLSLFKGDFFDILDAFDAIPDFIFDPWVEF